MKKVWRAFDVPLRHGDSAMFSTENGSTDLHRSKAVQ